MKQIHQVIFMKQKELQQHVERKSKEMELEKGDTAQNRTGNQVAECSTRPLDPSFGAKVCRCCVP